MEPEHILITGASGGIGEALIKKCFAFYPKSQVYAVARNPERLERLREACPTPEQLACFAADLSQPEANEELAAWLTQRTQRIDLAIHTLGVLNGQNRGPEKSLRDIDPLSLQEAFTVNAFSALWFSRSMKPLFRHPDRSVLMFLSAKVGSIGDNHLGGWYAYRMSKAALNMGVKNISLEYSRSACPTIVAAVHPGTTLTDLSRNHVKGFPRDRVAAPEQTAERLLNLAKDFTKEQSGGFFHWDGSPLPW